MPQQITAYAGDALTLHEPDHEDDMLMEVSESASHRCREILVYLTPQNRRDMIEWLQRHTDAEVH